MRTAKQWQLDRGLNSAISYTQWREMAEAYDKALGLHHWRAEESSSQYDFRSIRYRTDRLRSLKARNDYRGLLFTLNEGIHGNMGGMGRSSLYARAKLGTKHLIEEYIGEIVDSLEIIAGENSGDISPEHKLEFFNRASHCFGHSALLLSGSGSLLFFHVGVVKALHEAGLLPSVLAGSSGGAIVGSVICTHTDDELSALFANEAFIAMAQQRKRRGVVADVRDLEANLAEVIPDLTFQQAFEKTGRSMNISVAPAETHQTSRLLNAITSPSVLIRGSVMASAAVPGIFPPVTLQALDAEGNHKPYLPSRQWVDGSFSDDVPAKRLARLYGVNHHIVSQTNPYALLMLEKEKDRKNALDILRQARRKSRQEWVNAMMLIIDRMDKRNGLPTRVSSGLRSVMNQDYLGDINIMPQARFVNPLNLLNTPGEKTIRRLILSGERSTWPKLEMIHQQTRISRALKRILVEFDNPYAG